MSENYQLVYQSRDTGLSKNSVLSVLNIHNHTLQHPFSSKSVDESLGS